ncbi:MAG: hypothetical protein J2P28_16920, partial [Actinobacteria bacterium]|nr:hypothetical protein [Actinomycetota bacterium]
MKSTAELTGVTEPAKTKAKPPEAKRLRPGRAARAVIKDGRAVHDAIEAVLTAPDEAREVARRAYKAVRDQLVNSELDRMPVERLRELTRGRVTFAPIRDAGIGTVGAVIAAGAQSLGRSAGVRRKTARRVTAAAWQMRESVEKSIRVRIDPDARTPEQTALIAALRRYERARSLIKGPDLADLARDLGRNLDPAARAASRGRMLFTFSESKKQEARDALAQLDATLGTRQAAAASKLLSRAGSELDKADKTQRAARLWSDYLARPVA